MAYITDEISLICMNRLERLHMRQINYFPLAFLLIFGLTVLNGQAEDSRIGPASERLDGEMQSKQAAYKRHVRRLAKEHYFIQDYYDAQYYRLDLKIDPTTATIYGNVTIQGMSLVPSLSQVVLDLSDMLQVTAIGDDGATFTHANNLLVVNLATPADSGGTFSIDVEYNGLPAESGFGGFRFATHGDGGPWIWSDSEPHGARGWWPCKDVPSDKADSVDLILKIPIDQYAVSNGTLRQIVDDGDGWHTFHWHESYPIATYLVSVAVADYTIQTQYFNFSDTASMPILYYLLPEETEGDTLPNPPPTMAMMEYFHNTFGPYPFLREKYAIVRFGRGGGMENQTVTHQSRFNEGLTLHELAHQWWGDLITNASWVDIWLNEGFASYSEALFWEYRRGRDYYQGFMAALDWRGSFPYPILVDDTTDFRRIFDSTVYDKGAWVLHMLRHVVGDTNFFNILRSYATDPRFVYGDANTNDFKLVCEDVAGMDLDYFFDDWMLHAGRPDYGVYWTNIDTLATPHLYLRIDQRQDTGLLFRMPIDVFVMTPPGDTAFTIFNNEQNQVFEIPISGRASYVTIDPDNWILKGSDMRVTKVDVQDLVPTRYRLAQNYPNPFNPATVISYYLPASSSVNLTIYDLKGQAVATLVDEPQVIGEHRVTWNGFDRFGRPAANGIYFYMLTSDGFSQTKKMIVLR
jgi:aminopeptidase N